MRMFTLALLLTTFPGYLPSLAEESSKSAVDKAADSAAKSIYDITVKDIDGKDVALSKYKGDVLLIVNTASL